MRAGEERDIAAEAIDLEGRGVASVDERRVHVPDLFAGEHAKVRIEHVSRGGPVAFGRVLDRTTSHPSRRIAPCERHASKDSGKCTGCPLMTLGEHAQRDQKRTMLSGLGLEVDEVVASPEPLGYRWVSKRVAFDTRDGLLLGSYVRGTHRVASMRSCQVDHPAIRAAADALEDAARRLGVRAWSPRRPRGLRYVWMKTNGSAVLMTLVWGDDDTTAAPSLADALPENVQVSLGVQLGEGNALRGDAPVALRGAATLEVNVAGLSVDYGPLGFLQPNPIVAAMAYDDLLQDENGAPLGGVSAFDLYAGSGLTTARLRTRFESVVPCESYAESAAALGVAPSKAEDFLRAATEAPDLVVANPPRKGLGPKVCRELLRLGGPRLHIMACGPKGLARDLETLGSGYTLVALRGYDTLPQTPHVELVAKLVRH